MSTVSHQGMPQEYRSVVLLVDDQPMVAEAIRRMLVEETDIEFHYCQDSKRALESAEKIHPTVILQDLVMPDVDGMALIKEYRSHAATESLPVIMLSTREDPRDKSAAFELGASDYLVKIPDRIELIARIRAHSRSYLAQLQRDEAFRRLRELQKQLEESNAELQRISCQDGLTGIYNRRHFDTYLEQEWARATRDGAPVSLILIDIDYFKSYNDHYGHQSGDECLRRVAGVLVEVLQRPADLAARYGGEEFAIVLPKTDADGAETIAEAMRSRVERLYIPHAFSRVSSTVTISSGVGTVRPNPKIAPFNLIAMTDKALYQAKQAGRNRVQVAPRNMDELSLLSQRRQI